MFSISFTGFSSTPTPVKPGRTIADGTYFICKMNSGKYLDVSGASKVNGSNVIQHTFNRNENQQWNITYESDGYYRVSPVHAPGKALDTKSELLSRQNGTVSQMYQYKSSYQEQKWIIRAAVGGGYEFITKASSNTNTPKALEITNSSSANGAKAQIWTVGTSRTNDNWVLVSNNQAIYDVVTKVHNYAKSYNPNVAQSNKLLFQYIRRNKYIGSNWVKTAGSIDNGFVNYVDQRNNGSGLFRNDLYIIDSNYGKVDFIHMSATINALIYESTSPEALVIGDGTLNQLAGWAGDLQTLIIDVKKVTNESNDYNTFYNKIYGLLGNESYRFGMSDILADMDAIYLAKNMTSINFGSQLSSYYTTSSKYGKRFTNFVNGRTKEQLRDEVYFYTKNSYGVVQWPLFNGYTVTDNQSKAARDAFTDYIWNKKSAE